MNNSKTSRALLALAVLFTLFAARDLLIPFFLSIFIAILLQPVFNLLLKLRLGRMGAALLIMLALGGGAVYGTTQLVQPALSWMERLPEGLRGAQERLSALEKPAAKVSEAAAEVQELTGNEAPPGGLLTAGFQPATWAQDIVSGGSRFLGNLFMIMGFVFFFLARGNGILRTWIREQPGLQHRERLQRMVRRVQKCLTRYLGTITLINAAMGVCVALALWAIGMPTPILWGGLAALLNFIPYVGALTGISFVALVAFIQFDSLMPAIAAPLSYWTLNSLESFLVTPLFLGRRFSINPLFIFAALVFWGWFWGVAGMVLAVPFLVAAKVYCDHHPAYRFIARILER